VITNLLVDRVDDELQVRWRGGDDPTVFFSGSPDDAGTVIVPVSQPGRVRVAGLPEGFRVYVHVLDLDGEFVVAAERLVRVDGTRNLRDLGGQLGADRRAVRWGQLYRSDAIDALSPAGIEVFGRLGVRSVCDLRSEATILGRPAGLAPSVAWSRVAMGGDGIHDDDLLSKMATGEITEVTDEFMTETYGALLESAAGPIGAVVRRAADPGNHPMVFHGAAGKDRTGLVAALLLGALGVADPDILDDYELTNRYLAAPRVAALRPELAAQGVDIDRLLPYFTAPRPVMAALLLLIRQRYGSIEGYLTAIAEVEVADLVALRAGLLEQPS
jgi:protein-tyrosine phosphatase